MMIMTEWITTDQVDVTLVSLGINSFIQSVSEKEKYLT